MNANRSRSALAYLVRHDLDTDLASSAPHRHPQHPHRCSPAEVRHEANPVSRVPHTDPQVSGTRENGESGLSAAPGAAGGSGHPRSAASTSA